MAESESHRTRRAQAASSEPFFTLSDESGEPFADLYDHLTRRILSYFARRVPDRDTAVDLTAETFAKAFEKRKDFRGSTEARAVSWIWGIAHGVLGTYRRTKRIELDALGRIGLGREEDPERPLDIIETQGIVEHARQQLQQALADLPQDQAEVVRLRLVDELSYAEIARILGVSNEVVRARTSRGIRRLKMSDSLRAAVDALEL